MQTSRMDGVMETVLLETLTPPKQQWGNRDAGSLFWGTEVEREDVGGGGKQFWEVHLEGDPDEYYIMVGVAKTFGVS